MNNGNRRRHFVQRVWFAVGVALALTGLSVLVSTARAEDVPVDLELVLAVDVSRSMDPVEARLQREGYVRAIQHPEVLRAIRESGFHGRIAVIYFEWAGSHYTRVVSEWTEIDGLDTARHFAAAIEQAPFVQEFRTSISGALAFATGLFDDNGYQGIRRVIDVSGDGANNMGLPVVAARAAATGRGITINGLPIMTGRENPFGWFTMKDLDRYFAECVIGGPGSFLIPIRERGSFIEAIRRKLLLEIAGLSPPRRPVVQRAAVSPMDCLVGEKQWQQFIQDRYWLEN